MTYKAGHIKRDPVTGHVGIRTVLQANQPATQQYAWSVSAHDVGSRNLSDADVADWEDLYVPPDDDDEN